MQYYKRFALRFRDAFNTGNWHLITLKNKHSNNKQHQPDELNPATRAQRHHDGKPQEAPRRVYPASGHSRPPAEQGRLPTLLLRVL